MTTKKTIGASKSTHKKSSSAKSATSKAKLAKPRSSSKKKAKSPESTNNAKSRLAKALTKKKSAKRVFATKKSASSPRRGEPADAVADTQLSLFDAGSPAALPIAPPVLPVRPPALVPPAPAGPRWPESVIVHTDGACRGNPGPSSIGLHFLDLQGAELDRVGEKIGTQTNNYAEYTAVIRALEVAARRGVRRLTVRSDSELMVRQMQGMYKVKSEAIRPLFEKVKQLQRQFTEVRFEHVRREFNVEADRLANLALDGLL